MTLRLVDRTATGLRTAVEAYDEAGRFLPGREAGFRADEGGTQVAASAHAERREIAARLRRRGWDVLEAD